MRLKGCKNVLKLNRKRKSCTDSIVWNWLNKYKNDLLLLLIIWLNTHEYTSILHEFLGYIWTLEITSSKASNPPVLSNVVKGVEHSFVLLVKYAERISTLISRPLWRSQQRIYKIFTRFSLHKILVAYLSLQG